jgi:uncharacterized protein with HEPN domain
MSGVSYAAFIADRSLIDTAAFELIQISEAAKRLSPEFLKTHPNLPYYAMVGMRNRIVHEYGKVDYTILYHTLSLELPQLGELLKSFLV